MSDAFKESLRKVLLVTVNPTLAGRYYRLYSNWITHKGPEWTATRGKAIWNIANLLREGRVEQAIQVCLDHRIAHRQGIPKGPEGVVATLYRDARRPSRIKWFAAILRGYTAIRLPVLSKAQIAKSRTSINTEGAPDQEWEALAKPNRLTTMGWLPTRMRHETYRRPGVDRLRGTSSYPSLIRVSRKIKVKPFASMVASLFSKGVIPQEVMALHGNSYEFHRLRKYAELYQSQWYGDDTLGDIAIIQEGGAKGRVVAMPNAWIQFHMEPVHQALMALIKRLEDPTRTWNNLLGYSCVLDQVKGVHHAQRAKVEGATLHAVDLSSATDRFPLWVQQDLLTDIGLPKAAAAFGALKGPWRSRLTDELWYYQAGQPMGVYGSFPLFHLTNLALLNASALRAGVEIGTKVFAVLGDDVLIWHEETYQEYTRVLERLQVPISEHKSYSGAVAEFAGFMVVDSTIGPLGFRPLKYTSNGYFPLIPLMASMGERSKLFGQGVAKRWDIFKDTLKDRDLDLSPYLSEDRDLAKPGSVLSQGWFVSLVENFVANGDSAPLIADDDLNEGVVSWVSELFSSRKGLQSLQSASPEIFSPLEYQSEEPSSWWRSYDLSFSKDPLVVRERAKRAQQNSTE